MLPYEFIITVVGYILFGICLIIIILLSYFTPAMVFLRAKMKHVPVVFTKFKDNFAKFRVGTTPVAECTKVNGAPIHLTQGSHIIEMKSKTAIYPHFANHGVNTDWEYASVIQEIKEIGYEINTHDEYVHVLNLATNKDYEEEYLKNFEGKDKEKQEDLIKQLKNLKINISQYKTYKLDDLKNMFPFNVNSDFVEGITEEEINLALKNKKKHDAILKFLLTAGIVFAIIAGALAIFFTIVDIPDKNVVCDCVGKGVQMATNMTL